MEKRSCLETDPVSCPGRTGLHLAPAQGRAGLLAGLLLLGLSPAAAATPLDDIGFSALKAELGAAMPTGAGVSVVQVEGDGDPDPARVVYLPNLADAEFAGKTITDGSEQQTGAFSPHAGSVGRRFYGDLSSGTPGIATITGYLAEDWLGDGFLRASLPLFTAPQPLATASRIANHSWVGSAGNFDADALRRVDWLVERDEYLLVAGFTGGNSATLLGSAYNVIAVNQTRAPTDSGSVAVDSVYTAGRIRPDLVAPETSASNAVPMVASAAALLVQVAHADPTLSRDPVTRSRTNRAGGTIYNAERSEVIKAILMAGADRATANSGNGDITDYRVAADDRTANGLDRRYGAGQLNIHHSYRILAAGEQNHDQDDGGGSGLVGSQGFDYDLAFGGGGGTNSFSWYYLPVADEGAVLTAALVWNLKVDGGSPNNFSGTAALYDLSLELYDVSSRNPQLVLRSQSEADNSEHVWQPLAGGRRYALKVVPGTDQPAFNWDYALAWQQVVPPPPDGDEDGVPDAVDNCPATPNPDQANFDGDTQGDACDDDDDGDGVPDADDRFPLDAAEWADADADGVGDNADPDDDNDGLPDDWEELYGFDRTNPADAAGDADGDGLSQLEEFIAQTKPRDPDTDDDLVRDGEDNCRLAANADQRDTDADGQGDVCDPDDDADAVPDFADNCPLLANPAQEDQDGDGLGDRCDPFPEGLRLSSRLPVLIAPRTAGGLRVGYAAAGPGAAESGRAALGDPVSGAAVAEIGFTAGLAAVDAVPVADATGAGRDGIALLGFDALAEAPEVELRDAGDGRLVRRLAFNAGHVPRALAVLPDQTGNGAAEIAVLAERLTDGRGRVMIRDLQTRAKLAYLWLPRGYRSLDLAVLSDISGNGSAEVLVLAERLSDRKHVVLVRDTGGAGKISTIRLPAGHEPKAIAGFTSPGGAAVAVLASRARDERGRLLVYDAFTGARLWVATLGDGRAPVALRAWEQANGGWRLAVLLQRLANLRPLVSLYDPATGLVVENHWFAPAPSALDLALIPDTQSDTAGGPELVVLVRSDPVGALVHVQDLLTQELLRTLELP